MADTPPEIERINALTTNARNTWFVLLGALVFVGITLMGVEHIDFYGVDRATTLPLVNVEVPTRYFFVAAPILVAAIYGYFHLYLIRLWDALSDADPTVNGRPLGDVISPWLVTDAALYLRTQLRDEAEPSARHRLLEGSAMVLNFGIAWAFGLVVLFFLWWQSMPARTVWMTMIAGLSLFGAAFVGATSLAMLVKRMKAKQNGPQGHVLATIPAMSAVIVTLPLLLALSHQRTDGSTERLARLDMVGYEIVDRPAGWVPYALAKADFYERWCKRNGRTCKAITDLDAEQQYAFEREFLQHRDIALSDITKPSWSQTGARKPNFRGAQLVTAFLVNADLSGAQMQGADLGAAQMEGASLVGAQLEGADLSLVQIERADLSLVQLEGAILSLAQMEGADLSGAQMEEAILFGAQMEGADLFAAQMQGADLSGAQMEGANLGRAQMAGANLRRAQMARADLGLSHIVGLTDRSLEMISTNLNAATNVAGAFRFADLSRATWDDETDFRSAFLDGSVTLPHGFRARMGNPCQWLDVALPDEEFYGVWRWWLGKTDYGFYLDYTPPDYLDVPDPTPERLAELGLTDCEPGHPFGPMPAD